MKSTYHIDYKRPLNFRPEWAHLFKPDYKYKTVDLRVKELTHVFVNHYGLVIKNGLLVPGCAPNIGYAPSYDESAYFAHWRKATEQWLVCKFGKSIPSIKLDDNKKYLVIHSPWFSYYFWITECLPRILMVKDQLHELTLIYPESWKNISFVNETLSLFPQLQKVEIPADTHLFVKHLIMPEVKPWTPMFIPELVFEVRELLLDKTVPKKTRKIYLSREDAKRKKFSNEHDVWNILQTLGYEKHEMSGLTIFEQAQLMQEASHVVSITGAGMANFMFLSENAHVFDVTNEKYMHHKKYKFHFWKLCNIVGARYITQFCTYENNPEVPRFSLQNLIPDISEFEKNCILMEK
ncbi:MAG: glycosyltransferase family 61 protein [Bacteroidales bacterium]